MKSLNYNDLHYLTYLLVAAILFILELVYFKIAEHFRIIDKPNERSSHKHPTIRGGGIIFIVAVLLFSAWNKGAYPYLCLALLLSGIISFIDDIKSLPNILRFLAHLGSGFLILYEVGLFHLELIYLALILVLIIGVINAYNFMDGINGITGFYSLAVIFPLFYTEQDLQLKDLQLFTIIGLVVFLFFNARKRARCFAGDVGSVTMAIIVLFFLINRMYKEQNLNYAAFLLLYGTDTILTIVQRLYLRENIFKAHRRHLFQIYCNEYKQPHLLISVLYGVIQLAINYLIIQNASTGYLLPLLILIAGLTYIALKVVAYQRLR